MSNEIEISLEDLKETIRNIDRDLPPINIFEFNQPNDGIKPKRLNPRKGTKLWALYKEQQRLHNDPDTPTKNRIYLQWVEAEIARTEYSAAWLKQNSQKQSKPKRKKK